MFDAKLANETIRSMWDRDGVLPIKSVEKALRLKGLGRSTTIVSQAVKRFLGPSGHPENGAEAFPVDVALPQTASSKSNRSRKARTETGRAKRIDPATKSEPEDDDLKREITRLKRKTNELEDKLIHVEDRLAALETNDIRLLERVRNARPRQIEAFWSRVLTTVSEIMQSHDQLTLYDILEMLPSEIVQESIRISVPLNYETLSQKVSVPVPSEAEWQDLD